MFFQRDRMRQSVCFRRRAPGDRVLFKEALFQFQRFEGVVGPPRSVKEFIQ